MSLRSANPSEMSGYGSGILGISFNQEGHCFSIGLETGIRVYQADPLHETMRKDFDDGGIRIAEMLGRSNVIVLVGGGRNPRFPPNKVLVFDHKAGRYLAELEFRSDVRSVRLRRDRLVVVLRTKIFVYTLGATPTKLLSFDTADNEEGICALSSDNDNALLAFPSRQECYVQLVDLLNDGNSSLIRCHKSRILHVSLNADGTRLATASRKGTLIRVFDTATGRPVHELRRGSDRAVIYSIAFSHDSQRLCVASDKGTVHVFKLEKPEEGLNCISDDDDDILTSPKKIAGSVNIPSVKGILPKYFSSKWSHAHFHVADAKFVATFGSEKNSIIAVSTDGNYYKYTFDLVAGGDCIRQAYNKFLLIGELN